MALNQPVGIPFQNPTDYVGPRRDIIPIKRFPRRPLTTDKKYRIAQVAILGRNPSTGEEGELWYLARFEANGDATWLPFTTSLSFEWTEVTNTVASGDASIIFTGLTVFDEYKFQLEDLIPENTSARLRVEVSVNNGSSYLTGGCSSQGNGIITRDVDFFELTSSGSGVQSTVAGSSMNAWCVLGRSNPTGNQYASWNGFAIYNTTPRGGNIGGIVTNASASDVDAVRWTYDNGDIATGTIRVFGR